ncbi:helix-turn-helix domain-containing protein [Nafulsella turpanensis]|uniref:helix-turn-helix domain-containing protein n=1 Tax=Nafulsella turpanensis TaxID=1265690 RepID=UPI00034C5729|nr:helix-turn-helix domain-containing protein [Nafulsella turpanensis]
MATENPSPVPMAGSRLYRDQLITTEDLLAFKSELLSEIGRLFRQSSEEPVKKWFKSAEVRKLLGISPGTLQNLRVNGTLPFTKIGGVLFYDAEDIRKMLEMHRQQNSPLRQLGKDRLPERNS